MRITYCVFHQVQTIADVIECASLPVTSLLRLEVKDDTQMPNRAALHSEQQGRPSSPIALKHLGGGELKWLKYETDRHYAKREKRKPRHT